MEWKKLLEEYLPFIGLLIFGNIENLILASQGEVKKRNVLSLSIVSILGTILTEEAIKYSNYINFIGGLAIFLLGIQSVVEVMKSKKAVKEKEN